MPEQEKNLDHYVYESLKKAGIDPTMQGSNIPEIDEALKTASKKQTGEKGSPDITALVDNYFIIIEDKNKQKYLSLYIDGKLDLSVDATEKYAVNGALFYAQKIIKHTVYKKIFIVGVAGSVSRHIIKPFYVDEEQYIELPEIHTFENFNQNNINDYFRHMVLKEQPSNDVTLDVLLKHSDKLHKYLRNYGSLGEDEKSLVVCAILLALREQNRSNFSLDTLTCDEVNTDGAKLFQQLQNALTVAKVKPEVKLSLILSQFALIKERSTLNSPHERLSTANSKKSPLKFFAEYINENIYKIIMSNSGEDYIGRLYTDFVSYSGGDGNGLGVVLTPSHITELFCDLVNLRPDDVVLDPCCGTGGFLIASMNSMLRSASNDHQRKDIKEKQLHGIEQREDVFAIATTNMILRGDGQSNIICGDFFKRQTSDLQLLGGGVTVGFMNPPYSQAKDKQTADLSELFFTRQLLNSVIKGGRVAVILPITAMSGKTDEDKSIKHELLQHHTLEGVISLSKKTFYRIGITTCIAVFTAGEPHPNDKLVRFINFEDDGYDEFKHIGLVKTERAIDQRTYMLDCWFERTLNAPSKFMIKAQITSNDEWLHAYFYYDDEIPAEEDFTKIIAEYLTFEFRMKLLGHNNLFSNRDYLNRDMNIRFQSRTARFDSTEFTVKPITEIEWKPFPFNQIFPKIERGKRLTEADQFPGLTPYVSSTSFNNGVSSFIGNTSGVRKFCNCLTVANSGSVGCTFFHKYEFIASDHVHALKNHNFNQYIYLFLIPLVTRLREKHNFNREITFERIKREYLMLPVTPIGEPNWHYMEQFTRGVINTLISGYLGYLHSIAKSWY